LAHKSLNWKTLPVPVGPAGRVSGYAANDNLSLFTAGKNLEAAWNYSLIGMRDEIMLQLVQIGLNPASKPTVNKNPELQKLSYADALKVYVDQLESNSYDSVPTLANQAPRDGVDRHRQSHLHAVAGQIRCRPGDPDAGPGVKGDRGQAVAYGLTSRRRRALHCGV